MNIKYPDYNKGIVNLACSVLNHYGADCRHNTLPVFDELLKKDYKNVVVMLFDGFGIDALEHHLKKESFLRSHLQDSISSVFPPTTTAATTTIESGLTPAEHGWLGWSLYFNEIDKIVDLFINIEKDSKEGAANYHVAESIIPYKNIYEQINETGNAKAYSVSLFGTNKVTSFDEIFTEVKRLCNQDGKKYIYTYCSEPDSTMHINGCYSKLVTEWVDKIDKKIESMCNEITDTLVIVTADHGHINIEYKFISDYPNLNKMLERPISIEDRATCFFVKYDYKDQFASEFSKIFGKDFLLLTKKEVIEQKLFGDGKKHPKFEEFIGDFLAIAIADKAIAYNHESDQFISHHAGMTNSEMMIPFIAVEIE